ncbi:SRS domain-containing protein [Neospora caninum Liverpool]|uniref:SRS domain-containing protein n=1 Tax=Neospora caninum (strain Liverpool) TaxID=572307 RepID=F0VIU4_NEOCL|nr:SRS domain-containing protein [Neospora caninum Liverpool]CBZ53655.1 SRS domain-containing protein [Neospora caninum Liverpool]CEL67646.1 TPA: SRS domain-containing protein [Neospora caninum Liverpool]|eukprot:XP_003883687.1 SRS domain-containing protein [Neospora caninum Liverpool]
MALSFLVNCAGSEVPSRVSRIPRGLGERMRLRTFLVCVSTFLLLYTLSFSGCFRVLADGATDPRCVSTGPVTRCTCERSPGSNTPLTATLSKEKNVLEIGCSQSDLKCAPEELGTNEVCPSTTTSLKDCKNGDARTSTTKPININTLLSGSSTAVSWQSCEDVGEVPCTKKKLTIPPENFPFVDQKFVVGCVDDTKANDKMTVTVTLEARASATEDHIVKCAYGKNSNPTHQTVTLTPEKNSFTLVCGDKGDVLPTNYKEEYCVSETGTEASESCTGAYDGIFPNFETTWWTTTANSNEYKFTIPDGQFPAEEQKITVGCQKKTAGETEKNRHGSEKEDEAKSTVCSVDVTIVASAASSGALTSGMAVLLLSLAGFSPYLCCSELFS